MIAKEDRALAGLILLVGIVMIAMVSFGFGEWTGFRHGVTLSLDNVKAVQETAAFSREYKLPRHEAFRILVARDGKEAK